MRTTLPLAVWLPTAVIAGLCSSSSFAQYGSSDEQAARSACWTQILGGTDATVSSKATFEKIDGCVTARLGYHDPYMIGIKGKISAPIQSASKINLAASVIGGCYAIGNVHITFDKGGIGSYEDGTDSYAMKWSQRGSSVSFTAPFGITFYFRQITHNGTAALKKTMLDGTERGPYIRGGC